MRNWILAFCYLSGVIVCISGFEHKRFDIMVLGLALTLLSSSDGPIGWSDK